MTQGRDVGLQLPTFPVTEPTCWPEEGLILVRGSQQTGMRTGKVCESCLVNSLEHMEDMEELGDKTAPSRSQAMHPSHRAAVGSDPSVVVSPGYF